MNEYLKDNKRDEKKPEYSFWAENVSGKSYSSYNPETNHWEYNTDNTMNKVKKRPSLYKRLSFFFAKAICFGVLAGISFWGFQEIYYLLRPEARINIVSGSTNNFLQDKLNIDIPGKSIPKLNVVEPGQVLTTTRTQVSEVVEDTMPATVSIKSTVVRSSIWFGYSEEGESSGSGIIVGKNENELMIATNNHVVEGAKTIKVVFIDGTEAEAVVKGTDTIADLAVITVDIAGMNEETLNNIKIAKLGDSEDVKVGELAIAIGNALGYGQSVTVGYISAKDREIDVSDGYRSKPMVLLQTDAAINPGNSGGALLNIKGEVIGINTIKYASSGVEGMGYAIPITRAYPIISELMNREILAEDQQGFLGISGNDVTEDVAESFNMPIGVHIAEISKGGAAEKAGLKQNDIIIKLNGIEITSITQLREKVNSLRIGTEVEITFMRNINGTYEEKTVSVTLGPRPK